MKDCETIRSDRDLQDAVITYLADAQARRNPIVPLPLSPEQAQRAGKFARFLARRYYRDRLARSFRYSRLFGRTAESMVDTPAFDTFLNECVLGSLAAAERVGELAVNSLNSFAAPEPWWSDLLEYERLFFLQAASAENVIPNRLPRPGASARCRRFSWNLPDLLLRLKTKQAIGEELCREVVLLFSRTPHGRIYVMEVDEATAAAFHAADGQRDAVAIAQAARLPISVVQQILSALAQISALVTSSEK